MPTVPVPIEDAPYDVIVEPGALAQLGSIVRRVIDARPGGVLLAVDRSVAGDHGRAAAAALEGAGYAVAVAELVADEREKTLGAVRAVYETMLAARLERGSPLVAVGGGVIGDVAGFAAATYLRGVPLVQVPTTLLAMVDAAIGGKTGVNFPLPRADGAGAPTLGKNLIGAFWQPRGVVSDPRTLSTLPVRELRCGLAECVKHAVIADASLLDAIRGTAAAILAVDEDALTALVARSAAVKAAIVAEDEREQGRRALLNLGHTFAHVIETIDALELKHGEAVAIGTCAACAAAVETGRLGAGDAAIVRETLASLGLPVALPRPHPAAPLIDAMRFDKKVAGGRVRLVLPTSIGSAALFDDVPAPVITSAWRSVGASVEEATAPGRGGRR